MMGFNEVFYNDYGTEDVHSPGEKDHQDMNEICVVCEYRLIGRGATPPLVLMAEHPQILSPSHEAWKPHLQFSIAFDLVTYRGRTD